MWSWYCPLACHSSEHLVWNWTNPAETRNQFEKNCIPKQLHQCHGKEEPQVSDKRSKVVWNTIIYKICGNKICSQLYKSLFNELFISSKITVAWRRIHISDKLHRIVYYFLRKDKTFMEENDFFLRSTSFLESCEDKEKTDLFLILCREFNKRERTRCLFLRKGSFACA